MQNIYLQNLSLPGLLFAAYARTFLKALELDPGQSIARLARAGPLSNPKEGTVDAFIDILLDQAWRLRRWPCSKVVGSLGALLNELVPDHMDFTIASQLRRNSTYEPNITQRTT